MTKPTPDPWAFITASNGDCGFFSSGTGVFIECYVDIRYPDENARAEAIANATLVRAAPEMLRALKAINDFGSPSIPPDQTGVCPKTP